MAKRTEEQRERTRQAVARWRAANPDKAKQQTREAACRYDEKYPGVRIARKREQRAAKRRQQAAAQQED